MHRINRIFPVFLLYIAPFELHSEKGEWWPLLLQWCRSHGAGGHGVCGSLRGQPAREDWFPGGRPLQRGRARLPPPAVDGRPRAGRVSGKLVKGC